MKDWEGVTITGKIVEEMNRPVPEAHVYAYQEGSSNTLGPADAMSEPTGEDGAYMLILPKGTYTIVARKRLSGSISGPLKNGDMTGQLSKFLDVGPDNRTNVNISMRIFRQGVEGDPKRILTTDTRVRGKVVDAHGRVYPGILVFAYNGSFRQNPPDHIALPTDSEGRFEISLPGGGKYTIGARSGLKGKPQPNDSIGFWGDRDKPRRIREGEIIEGIVIVMKPYEEVP